MRIKDYIQATYETIRAGQSTHDTLVKLKSYLDARGLSPLYPRVLRGLVEQFRRSDHHTTLRIIVARDADAKNALAVAKKHAEEFGSSDRHVTHVDPSIIGGFILEQDGKRLDQSYKRKLLDTYRRLTS